MAALSALGGGCQNDGPFLGVHIKGDIDIECRYRFTIWVAVKIMVPFWGPKYEVAYYMKDPKGDHNFDNHPHGSLGKVLEASMILTWTPKVCLTMALWAVLRGSGPLFYILVGLKVRGLKVHVLSWDNNGYGTWPQFCASFGPSGFRSHFTSPSSKKALTRAPQKSATF